MQFNISGVRIKIGFLFAAVVTLLFCYNTGDEIRLGILFALVHETGHLIAIICCGEKPESVCFGLFGMSIIRSCDISQNYKKEIITALAGPFTNYFVAVALIVINSFLKNELLLKAAVINIMLGSFNIMPVFSLDGGRALESALKMKFDEPKSEKVLKLVSFIVLVIMMAFGFYILIESGYNFTFLAITIYLMVLLFVKC